MLEAKSPLSLGGSDSLLLIAWRARARFLISGCANSPRDGRRLEGDSQIVCYCLCGRFGSRVDVNCRSLSGYELQPAMGIRRLQAVVVEARQCRARALIWGMAVAYF